MVRFERDVLLFVLLCLVMTFSDVKWHARRWKGSNRRGGSEVRIWTAVGANPVHHRLFCEPSWNLPGSEVRMRTAVPWALPPALHRCYGLGGKRKHLDSVLVLFSRAPLSKFPTVFWASLYFRKPVKQPLDGCLVLPRFVFKHSTLLSYIIINNYKL